MIPGVLRRRVLLSGTVLVTAAVGYGRRAYGQCAPTVAPSYQCLGVNVTTQTISANNASVSTVAGFSVNTAAGDAITITGDGALSYTDTNASPLTTTGGTALTVRSVGDDVGTSTPGSVTINTNGALSGLYGVVARNYGTGVLTITANGNVTGTGSSGVGIDTYNSHAGTNLTVTTGAGTTVSGVNEGIFARSKLPTAQPRADHHRQRQCHRHRCYRHLRGELRHRSQRDHRRGHHGQRWLLRH